MPKGFNKWDPDATPPEPTAEEIEAARREAVKAWVLRWGWLVASLFAAFGYVILALVLAGQCGPLEWMHIPCR